MTIMRRSSGSLRQWGCVLWPTRLARTRTTALVRPNRRGRIPVRNAEKWLAPHLPGLDPPRQDKKDRAVTIDLSGCVLGDTHLARRPVHAASCPSGGGAVLAYES